ncbi:MAG: prephenate dehydrogenase [Candidatus Poribacteria bacterium]|nr:prephenate dehydrogenase [Candidatus Poribacteria bacterium]
MRQSAKAPSSDAFETPFNDRVGKIALYAVGLINGSLGLALRRAGFLGETVGIGRRAETLEIAKAKGAIDRYVLETEAAPALDGADMVVSGAPVHLISDSIRRLSEHAPETAVFTDVGSVKASIVCACQSAVSRGNFVGGHPIAGSHRTGAGAAEAELFDGRVCVLTPTSETRPAAVALVRQMWELAGMRVIEISPETHDALLAASSHLPHAAAAVLASVIGAASENGLRATAFAGGGYLDTTRIAQGSADLWEPILRMNAKPVEKLLRRYAKELTAFADALAEGNGREIHKRLDEARRARHDQ